MPRSSQNPMRGFLDVMSEMERMRHLARHGAEPHQETTARNHVTAWVPSTDIAAHGQDLVITTEIPGVAPRDIDVSVSEGVLTISGDRPGFPEDDEHVPYVRERYYGAFRRAIVLPEGADATRITADFDHGVVTITVPNAVDTSAASTHRIEIVETGTQGGRP